MCACCLGELFTTRGGLGGGGIGEGGGGKERNNVALSELASDLRLADVLPAERVGGDGDGGGGGGGNGGESSTS